MFVLKRDADSSKSDESEVSVLLVNVLASKVLSKINVSDAALLATVSKESSYVESKDSLESLAEKKSEDSELLKENVEFVKRGGF